MKLVIEIPDDIYDDIQHNKGEYINTLNWAVRNGTPYDDNGDCISRNALKAVIETYRPFPITSDYGHGKNNMIDYCLDEIDNAQAVEARQKSEWITVHFDPNELNAPEKSKFDFVKCPFCETIHQGRHNFCSRCGADMRGNAE